MRPKTFIAAAGVMLAAAPLLAQTVDPYDRDPKIVIKVPVRDVIQIQPGRSVREVRAYQGRNNGPEQTERFSRKVRVGRDGRVSVDNIAGDITVTAASGDDVSIEAVKRTRGPRSELANVNIRVEEGTGRVDIHTDHERNFRNRDGNGDHVSVDYMLSVPSGAAVNVHSISGNIRVTGSRGTLRLETISGDVNATDTPKIELAKSVSGTVTLSGVSTDGDLAIVSISGNVVAKSVKVHALDLSSVSGNVNVSDITCDRLSAKSISGGVEYTGAISKGGSYDINVHSGTIRLNLANPSGFVLNANSFSGSIRSDLPLTIGGPDNQSVRDRRGPPRGISNRSIRATYGDGSATLTVRTFSGDIVISKR